LDGQLKRLEQLLVYCEDSKQELATVNLLVQRNIPVTFAKPASEVINDTIDPEEQPLVMKAIPLKPAAKPAATPSHKPKRTPSYSVKRAIPIEKGKRKGNGQ
jgi:hypothetical protein